MRKISSLLIVIFLFVHTATAQTTKSAAKLALESEISTLKKDPALKHAAWSLYVYNITNSEIEADYNSQMSLMPASIQKTITTATALALLGEHFKFETRLQYTGTLDTANGILHGNVYLTGGGDPTLGSKRFGNSTHADSVLNRFARKLIKAGIRHIDGFLIADESIFDDRFPQSWGYEDVGNYYGCTISGLSIYENMYRLYFDAGASIGDSAKLVDMEPNIPEINFINMVTTGATGSGDQVYIMGSPYTYLRQLDGTVPLGKKRFDVDGALPDPAKTCAVEMLEALTQHGISLSKGITTSREEHWKGPAGLIDTATRITLSTHYSPELSKIVYYTNLKSVNMFAENILKMLGAKKSGEGSTKKGIEVVRQYWVSKGIDLAGFEMADGCGLSRKNKLTAQQLCKMLAVFSKDPAYAAFDESLPIAGKSGGLSSMLSGTVAEENLRAKTGTMDGVRSFAGYVTNTVGEDLAFVIIMNNFPGKGSDIRKKCERLMGLIAGLD